MNWTTNSLSLVTTARSVLKLVCFQPIPLSCSCKQTTFLEILDDPSGSVMTASKYLMTPKQSHPRARLLAARPDPASPKSNACLRWNGALGSPYGTVISLRLSLYRTLRPSYLTLWRTAPSRGVKPSLFMKLASKPWKDSLERSQDVSTEKIVPGDYINSPKTPFLPLDQFSIDLERRSFWLDNIQRFDICTEWLS